MWRASGGTIEVGVLLAVVHLSILIMAAQTPSLKASACSISEASSFHQQGPTFLHQVLFIIIYYYQFCQMTGSHKRITCKRVPQTQRITCKSNLIVSNFS